jgi:hypothetical protein
MTAEHITEGALQALLDGELPLDERAAVERHLAGCLVCRREVAELRAASDTLAVALAALDRAPERMEAARAASRRRSGWAGQARRALPRAALFVLGAAGVASAALPGSPLRGWVEDRWRDDPAPSAVEVRAESTAAPASPPPEDEARSAGIGVLPVDGEVRVSVESPAPELRIRVRVADQRRAEVRGRGAAAEARFRTGPGQVSVIDAGPGELEVVIPRTARRVSISVNGRRLLLKDGEDLHLLVPADSVGAELVFPVGS